MKLIKEWADMPETLKGAALAIGNFDGVHRGHQAVISIAKNIAQPQNIPWGILSFEPHPRLFFAPDSKPFLLTSPEAKARIFNKMGADLFCAAPFNAAFAALSPQDFIEKILIESLGASHIICGEDFVFGHKRSGSIKDLQSTPNFKTHIATEITDTTKTRYSSSLIRQEITSGNMETAQKMLGRPFEIEGTIIKGDKRGRQLGFPTANIKLNNYIRPQYGVYAISAAPTSKNTPQKWHQGLANIGNRPTIGSNIERLEAHLFNFNQDIYTQNWRIKLHHHIRKEQKFKNLKALTTQIKTDCQIAKTYFKNL